MEVHPDVREAMIEAERELRNAIAEPGHSVVEDRLIDCCLNLLNAIKIYITGEA